MKKMKMFLIHHSHTDVGYTERQEKIEWNHIKYIERVVDILREAYEEGKREWRGFKWVCESFWCVEKFLKSTTKSYKDDFIKYVKEGYISLSGNYLNCNELIDETVLLHMTEKSVQTANALGVNLSCGMTADINGYSWGYPSSLIDCGIENLLSQVHTHHGYHATLKKQHPFFWQAPNGKKILVWQGEHYHIGNEFGIHGFEALTYTVFDGLDASKMDYWEVAKLRIFAYVKKLQAEGYTFDFFPITVSGLNTDNSPPSEKTIEFVQKWNKEFGEEIEIQMAGLEDFFSVVRQHENKIETHSGDWADWWADGVGSTPATVKLYKEAVRKYLLCRKLDPDYKITDKNMIEDACYHLMLYAEHTWGHSASITEPYHTLVNVLDKRNDMYAIKAHESASYCLDSLCENYGETAVILGKDYRFNVVNPHSSQTTTIAKCSLEYMLGHQSFNVIDEITEEKVPHQIAKIARGHEINLLAALSPNEKRTYRVEDKPESHLNSTSLFAPGCDMVDDINKNSDWLVTPYEIITPYLKITYKYGEGILSIYDRKANRELTRSDSAYKAFTPIYEVTPAEDYEIERKSMGRNRKKVNTERSFGRLTNIQISDFGDVFIKVLLSYELKGTSLCQLELIAYKDMPKLDLSLNLHKNSVWEPENLYLAMPFTTGDDEEIWIDKTGALLRPRVDQIPGTCVDFYLLQNGVYFVGNDKSIVLSMPDTPLIAMGELDSHPIRLSGEDGVINRDMVYSWVMNNFWETNFKADLGGFYQFNYSLRLVDSASSSDCLEIAKQENMGVLSFLSFDK